MYFILLPLFIERTKLVHKHQVRFHSVRLITLNVIVPQITPLYIVIFALLVTQTTNPHDSVHYY
jgi:hypothetical protein